MSAMRAGSFEAIARDLREHAFGAAPAAGGAGRPRIGVEVEFIPVNTLTGARVPIHAPGGASSLAWLRRLGGVRGWALCSSPGGVVRFRLPDGGALSFEPGGQLEYSSPPCLSPETLLTRLRTMTELLRSSAAEHGIALLSVGLDPWSSLEEVPLQLHSGRYDAMDRFFARQGQVGAWMMRQTASFQLNLDFEHEPLRRWRLLNALAPYVVAMFANSPLREGRRTGCWSTRAQIWRALEPARTGIFSCARDPVAEYLEFALDAPMMLARDSGGGHPTARDRLHEDRLSLDAWRDHLTTLFPEVRPKGYLELRSADAVEPLWYAAPVALVAGTLYHAPSLAAAEELVGDPDPTMLERAGRAGLGDPTLASVARDLANNALDGCRALGDDFLSARNVDVAREYFTRYTARGSTPANELIGAEMSGEPRGSPVEA